MKLNREQLLNQLESVLPGLSTKELIEQSSCFVFKDGKVLTFNDEIACVQTCDVGIEGAVPAMPIVNLLRKMIEDEIALIPNEENTKLKIKGKRKQATIPMQAEIQLPIEAWEKPRKWRALPEEFIDAVSLVAPCASIDQSQFDLTCVHFHPDYLESCDGVQACRYLMDTGIKKEFVVRRDSVKHIISLDMQEVSETKNWAHYRNSDGLILSCRRYKEDYRDISEIFDKTKGRKFVMPKGIKEVCEKAVIFSAESLTQNEVTVALENGKMTITAKGEAGRYKETKKTTYSKKPCKFNISPTLLSELSTRYNDCLLSEERMKIRIGKYTYITVLGKVG